MTIAKPYKRVLLKLSGEALMGDDAYGINRVTIDGMVAQVAQAQALGVELFLDIKAFRGCILPSFQPFSPHRYPRFERVGAIERQEAVGQILSFSPPHLLLRRRFTVSLLGEGVFLDIFRVVCCCFFKRLVCQVEVGPCLAGGTNLRGQRGGIRFDPRERVLQRRAFQVLFGCHPSCIRQQAVRLGELGTPALLSLLGQHPISQGSRCGLGSPMKQKTLPRRCKLPTGFESLIQSGLLLVPFFSQGDVFFEPIDVAAKFCLALAEGGLLPLKPVSFEEHVGLLGLIRHGDPSGLGLECHHLQIALLPGLGGPNADGRVFAGAGKPFEKLRPLLLRRTEEELKLPLREENRSGEVVVGQAAQCGVEGLSGVFLLVGRDHQFEFRAAFIELDQRSVWPLEFSLGATMRFGHRPPRPPEVPNARVEHAEIDFGMGLPGAVRQDQ